MAILYLIIIEHEIQTKFVHQSPIHVFQLGQNNLCEFKPCTHKLKRLLSLKTHSLKISDVQIISNKPDSAGFQETMTWPE